MLRKLKKAGLVRVQTGIESGSSKESKELHNRSPGNTAILKFAEANKEMKLSVVYDVIIDNPHATEEMKMETAEFLLELPRPYDIYFYSLNYFPGTALTKKALEDGSLQPHEVERVIAFEAQTADDLPPRCLAQAGSKLPGPFLEPSWELAC